MRIAVFGAGGVGGYFGGRLAQAGADVHLIARGRHLDALRRGGLRVRSVFGDFTADLPATSDPADVGPVDVVLFTVKSTDTLTAARRLGPLLDDGTGVVSLQNGVDNEDRIAEVVGARHVLGGVAFIFSTIGEPGVIEHTGGPASLVFGELDGRRSDRAERLLALATDAGVAAELSTDIRVVAWRKFVFIVALAGMTAATRLPIGEIRSSPAAWDLLRRVVDEVAAVGRARGIDLPVDVEEQAVSFAAGLDAGSFSSLHYDLTHGKPMELDALHGTVVRYAVEAGVDVPATSSVHALLEPWARRNAG